MAVRMGAQIENAFICTTWINASGLCRPSSIGGRCIHGSAECNNRRFPLANNDFNMWPCTFALYAYGLFPFLHTISFASSVVRTLAHHAPTAVDSHHRVYDDMDWHRLVYAPTFLALTKLNAKLKGPASN